MQRKTSMGPLEDEMASPLPNERSQLQNESTIGQLRQRCQDFERQEDELQERARELADRRDCLEAQVKELERESVGYRRQAAEQVQRLEAEKRVLESELEKVQAANIQ